MKPLLVVKSNACKGVAHSKNNDLGAKLTDIQLGKRDIPLQKKILNPEKSDCKKRRAIFSLVQGNPQKL